MLGELRHEPLKRASKLIRIEITKQPTERIVTRYAVRQLEKAAQKSLFRLCKLRHVDGTLSSTQHRAQSNHQKFMKVVQTGIATSGVLKTLPTRRKLFQGIFTGHAYSCSNITPRTSLQEATL